jgi:hypothetical protein
VKRKEIINTCKTDLQESIEKTALQLDKVCRDAATLVNSMVEDIASGNIGRLGKEGEVGEDGLWILLQEILLLNRHFYSAAVARRPYGFDPLTRLYWRVYLKNKNKKSYIVPKEDYTLRNWYLKAMENNGYWMEPFYNKEGKHLTAYSASFNDPMQEGSAEKPLGVVMITIALEGLKKMVADLDQGAGSSYALLSRNGRYLYHKDHRRVKMQHTILDQANSSNGRAKLILSERITRGEGGIIDYKDKGSGKKYWLIYHPVPATGWSLQNIYEKDYLFKGRNRSLEKKLTLMIISAICFQLFLVLLLVSVLRRPRK